MKLFDITVLLALLGSSSTVLAGHDHSPASDMATATAPGASALTSGEVKKVDKAAAKLTIQHGPIASLDMPPMTMVFKVKDPAMLDALKAGDKISFAAERIMGGLTVTRIEAAK